MDGKFIIVKKLRINGKPKFVIIISLITSENFKVEKEPKSKVVIKLDLVVMLKLTTKSKLMGTLKLAINTIDQHALLN